MRHDAASCSTTQHCAAFHMCQSVLKLVQLTWFTVVLHLPIATTGVERAFSMMSLVKIILNNKIVDSVPNDFLVIVF